MEQFNTLLEAAECVVTRRNSWRFATSDEKYDTKGLMGIAKVSDAENPADEDSFYVVTLGGSIGFCEDSEDIDWLFIADSAPNEDLPLTYQAAPQARFCSQCGAPVVPSARFCGKCGNKL